MLGLLLTTVALAAPEDWLLKQPSDFKPTTITTRANSLVLGNGLASRTFSTSPDFACVSFLSELASPPTEILRTVGPEAQITLDGAEYQVGGLVDPLNVTGANCSATHCPDAARRGIFTDAASLAKLRRNESAWHYKSHTTGTELVKHFEWTPGTRFSPRDVSWPPQGAALHVVFSAPSTACAEHQKLEITVHYELTQGAPIFSKWVSVGPKPGVRASEVSGVVVQALNVELLHVTTPFSPLQLSPYPSGRVKNPSSWQHTSPQNAAFPGRLWVEMDQSHSASINWQDDARVEAFDAQAQGGLAPGAGEPVLNVSYNQHDGFGRPAKGYRFGVALDPALPGTENATFVSMRALELVLQDTDPERSGMAIRRMKRLLAPAVQENPVFMHLTAPPLNASAVERAALQMQAVGFEMIMFSFGSGFDLESTDPAYVRNITKIIKFAHEHGNIEVGAYDLIALSRHPPNASWSAIDPVTLKPEGNACFASHWVDYLSKAVFNFISKSKLSAIETDGPYGGQPCANNHNHTNINLTGHEYHKGLGDSEYRQNTLQARFFSKLKNTGMYIHAPENYDYYGQSKSGMGYNENQFSLPRWEDLEISRRDMYDSTFHEPVTRGWMFVPLTGYHADPGNVASFAPASTHMQEYEWALAQYFSYGVMPCWRGPLLYDTPASEALVKKWVSFYKQHRGILTSDIVHVRRPDTRGIDAILHVNPRLAEHGLIVVFNPTAVFVNVSLSVNLYYTGLSASATVTERGVASSAKTLRIGRDYTVELPIALGPRSVTWFVVKDSVSGRRLKSDDSSLVWSDAVLIDPWTYKLPVPDDFNAFDERHFFGVGGPATATGQHWKFSADAGKTWKSTSTPGNVPHPGLPLLPTAPGVLQSLGGGLFTNLTGIPDEHGWSVQKPLLYKLLPDGSGFTIAAAPGGGASHYVNFSGVPAPGVNRSVDAIIKSGSRNYGVARAANGDWVLQSDILWNGEPVYSAHGTNFTMMSSVSFTSSDGGWSWKFGGVIANASDVTGNATDPAHGVKNPLHPKMWGPSESDVTLMADKKTLLSIERMDGDSRCFSVDVSRADQDANHTTYRNYATSFSTNHGKSWSYPQPVPGTGCARPRIKQLLGGALLLTGGRLCVENKTDIFLWVNADGDAKDWTRHSITAQHNRLWQGDSTYLFTDMVNDSSVFETLSYTSILPTGPHSAVITYNKFNYSLIGQNNTFPGPKVKCPAPGYRPWPACAAAPVAPCCGPVPMAWPGPSANFAISVSLKSDDPIVIWTSNPTLPNETAFLKTPAGASFSTGDAVKLCDCDGSNCEVLPLIQPWERSAKLLIPASRPRGAVWSVRSNANAELATLNNADPWSSLCHLQDTDTARASIGDPTFCKPGVSTLRIFGRGLGWAADGSCANQSSAVPALTSARLTSLDDVDAAPTVLSATVSSCYASSFSLPASLRPGKYSVDVSNTLKYSKYAKLGASDPTQAVLEIVAAPTSSVFGSVSASDGVEGLLKMLNASTGKATPVHRLVVAVGAGTFKFGPLQSLIIPDGVHLRGAGMDASVFEWPTQTGKLCVARKADRVAHHSGPNPNPALISSSVKTRRYDKLRPARVLGWGLEAVTVNVVGGFEQNDTMAAGGKPGNAGLCHGIAPCMESSSADYSRYDGVDIRSVNVSIVAATGGVDMRAGGVGMGPALSFGSGCFIDRSVITTFGNCGSNVTPLLALNNNHTIVRNNRFFNGCTIYSARSVVSLLWENTVSHYKCGDDESKVGHGCGGRGGNVIATFGAPFRLEYVIFKNNTQTNNPVLPNASVVKNPPTNHRIEGLTLDGGGGAYTGGVKSATASSVTIAQAPFKNGTGTYSKNYMNESWVGAALMILTGKGAGQWRRVVGTRGPKGNQRMWEVDVPWHVPPDATSQVQIGPLRGHILLESSSWTTAYTVQLYGMCIDSVVASNKFDTTPFYVWGRNPHGWGYQPNWNIEVLNNRLPNSHGITALTCDQEWNICKEQPGAASGPAAFNGALNSAVVIRNNWMGDGQGISIHGTTSDAVIERNLVHNGDGSFMKAPISLESNHTDHLEIVNNKADS